MKVHLIWMAVVVVAVILSTWTSGSMARESLQSSLIAVKWGDGRYGPAFYGAYVYLVPVGSHYSVQGVVHIGRGGGYSHNCGQLGVVNSPEVAVKRWGNVDWKADGLHIGSFFLPQAEVEAHR